MNLEKEIASDSKGSGFPVCLMWLVEDGGGAARRRRWPPGGVCGGGGQERMGAAASSAARRPLGGVSDCAMFARRGREQEVSLQSQMGCCKVEQCGAKAVTQSGGEC